MEILEANVMAMLHSYFFRQEKSISGIGALASWFAKTVAGTVVAGSDAVAVMVVAVMVVVAGEAVPIGLLAVLLISSSSCWDVSYGGFA